MLSLQKASTHTILKTSRAPAVLLGRIRQMLTFVNFIVRKLAIGRYESLNIIETYCYYYHHHP
jgi:hypothetical protein